MPSDTRKVTRRTACKKMLASAVTVCAADLIGEFPAYALSGPRPLPRVAPGEACIAPSAILDFIAGVEKRVGGLHSFMILQNGKVEAEAYWAPYGPQHPHMLYSLSKSFTSTAVGFAIAEGKISVDTLVTSYFPEKLPAEQSDNLKAMKVKHLLTMSTGHDKDATGGTTAAADGDWIRAFLALSVEHEPGTKFVYNSAATYMLSAIVQKTTGLKVVDYLKPRLFEKIGIEQPTWETCPHGINTGGWGLAVKTEDIARFGQLYLQNGVWESRRVLPEHWVDTATTKKIVNGDPNAESDWTQGYCYQFWRCRHDAFRGDGAFGQFCIVLPKHNAVIAITSGVGDMQAILDEAWLHLLPALGVKTADQDATALQKQISHLEIPYTKPVKLVPSGSQKLNGARYKLNSNSLNLESVRFVTHGNKLTAAFTTTGGELNLVGDERGWAKGAGQLPGIVSHNTAGHLVWIGEDVCELTLCYNETPFIQTLRFSFTQQREEFNLNISLRFFMGPTQFGQIKGTRV